MKKQMIIERVLLRLLEISSGETFKPTRNKSVNFSIGEHPELTDEFFGLISTAYAEIGGHLKIKSPNDIMGAGWDWWEGVDLHDTNDFDLIMFGKKTKYGVKFAGVGHDGSSASKRKYITQRIDDLLKPGYYVEVSGRVAEIFMNAGVPVVDNKDDVEKVLGKKVKWLKDGWYERAIGGQSHAKIMLGKPRV